MLREAPSHIISPVSVLDPTASARNSAKVPSRPQVGTTSLASQDAQVPIPSSILVIGAGVFGLSTALALTLRPQYQHTAITVVDRSTEDGVFPARDASSIDTSRIVRADYADPAYAALAAEAQTEWRKQGDDDLGGQGRYDENGLILVADNPPSASTTPHASDHSMPPSANAGKKTGMHYVQASWQNVKDIALSSDNAADADSIRELDGPDAIRAALGTGGSTGDWGYINTSSGWADADASMAWLHRKVKATGRITFVRGVVTSLNHTDSMSKSAITGITLSDNTTLSADLTILATGAWTGALLNLHGNATATGQVLGYMAITDEEQAKLAHIPTILNLSTGYFVIPPSKNVLKVARHAYGYLNPTASDASASGSESKVSLPWTKSSKIPTAAADELHDALLSMIPLPQLRDRPFTRTRLCWYTDTPSGDFIVDYHPSYSRTLMLATGGSGHAFKFLPVLGERVVDCLLGECPVELRDKWAWKDLHEGVAVTEDGSRGGVPAQVLSDYMTL